MPNEIIGEAFAQLYCNEKGIKPKYCHSTLLKASSTISITYRENEVACRVETISVGDALDMLSRRILRLEEKQVSG